MEASSEMFASLAAPQNLFCEEDERYLDYDVEVLKDFNLFSSTFSIDDLMKEIPCTTDHLNPSSPPAYRKPVREDCMWARKVETKEPLEIDINNNFAPSQQHYDLVPPDLILPVRQEGLWQHCDIACPCDFPSSSESFHSDEEQRTSPNSSDFESGKDTCLFVW